MQDDVLLIQAAVIGAHATGAREDGCVLDAVGIGCERRTGIDKTADAQSFGIEQCRTHHGRPRLTLPRRNRVFQAADRLAQFGRLEPRVGRHALHQGLNAADAAVLHMKHD